MEEGKLGPIKTRQQLYKLFIDTLYIDKDYTLEELALQYQDSISYTRDPSKKYKSLADVYHAILTGGIQNNKSCYSSNNTLETIEMDDPNLGELFTRKKTESISQMMLSEIEILESIKPKEEMPATYTIQYIKMIFKWLYDKSHESNVLDDDTVFQRLFLCIYNQMQKIVPGAYLPLLRIMFDYDYGYLFDRNMAIMQKKSIKTIWTLNELQRKNNESGSLSSCARSFFTSIENAIAEINESDGFGEDDAEIIRFLSQLMIFVLSAEGCEEDKSYIEALSYLAYFIGECFIEDRNSDRMTGLEVAFDGINISDYWDRQDAFNTLGILAINTPGQIQLAYDVYYSWVNRKIIGELKSRRKKNTSILNFDQKEKAWRMTEQGKKCEAIMHRNLAYISAIIGDSYEVGEPNRKTFYQLAEKEIKNALHIYEVELEKQTPDEESFLTYSLYGDIIETQINDDIKFEGNDYKEVLTQFEKYYKGARENTDNIAYQITKADSLIQRCLVIIELIASSYVKNRREESNDFLFEEWNKSNGTESEERLSELIEIEKEFRGIGLVQIKKRLISALESTSPNHKEEIYATTNFLEEIARVEKTERQIKDLLDFYKEYHDRKMVIPVLLYLVVIRYIVNQIHYLLRRRNYCNIQYLTRDKNEEKVQGDCKKKSDVIAYYTTLNTAKYIFDELYRDSKDIIPREAKEGEKGLNCLTVTHANYMNDPYEGLALLDALMQDLSSNKLLPEGSTQRFRDDIYNDTFIFLKSFTNQIDKLTMWNRYASDSNVDGKNSNGCCIQFNPEMFNHKINYTSAEKTLLSKDKDDYYLYRMVYIGGNDELFKSNNPDIPEDVEIYTKMLKRFIFELNEYLNTKSYIHQTRTIEAQLQKDIWNSLRISLQTIIFLYKSDDYADENESRLLFTREFSQQDTISFLKTDPPKLAIKPYMQVYIDKIIFGPNARNRDVWEPFFQYGLNKMWKKYEEITKDKSCPVYDRYKIEGSKIHYHT